jgi:hypothetical protein
MRLLIVLAALLISSSVSFGQTTAFEVVKVVDGVFRRFVENRMMGRCTYMCLDLAVGALFRSVRVTSPLADFESSQGLASGSDAFS